MHNKKAQVSEGVTWIVATLSIIVILLIAVFVTSFYVSNNKGIQEEFFATNIQQKSFLSYLLTQEAGGQTVYSKIKESGNLNEYNGNLALKIFKEGKEEEYSEIWIGTSWLGEGTLGNSFNGNENEFFGKKPSARASGAMGAVIYKDYLDLIIPYENKKYVEALFSKK